MLMLMLRPRGSSCVLWGLELPSHSRRASPGAQRWIFVDGAWHVCTPTGSFCRPTDAGLCVGLTRGRGPCDVNASAIMVKIPSIMAFSDPEQPRVQELPLLSRWIMRDFFVASHATPPASIETTMYQIPSTASPTAQ